MRDESGSQHEMRAFTFFCVAITTALPELGTATATEEKNKDAVTKAKAVEMVLRRKVKQPNMGNS
jgi:hypothetical protein